MAVDYTTATAKRLNLQALADSAALAGGSTFDGTNESEAKEVAAAYLKAHSEGLPDDNAFDVKMHGQTLEVSLNGSYDNVFMDIVGQDVTPLSVKAAAVSPMKPKKITFTPTNA